MSLTKQLLPQGQKFTPATPDVDWLHINTLVHGPGADNPDRRGGDGNSAVFACLMAIALAYPEPPLHVYRRGLLGKEEELPDQPMQRLLSQPTPNGELSLEEMWFWTAWAKHTDGNAYWLKVRSGNETTGNVVELWPVSPRRMRPITRKDTNGRALDWISYYELNVAPNQWERVPPENVVHFRLGVDDRDMRYGLSPLKRLVRQISTDEEADNFTDALLKNFAVPGLVVIPTGNTHVDKDDADRISETFRRKYSGDDRGKVVVLSKESEVSQFGFSPEQMTLTALHRIPEERIAAVLGVPAIVAGLGAGLERSTYSNFREAREMLTETTLVPLWRADAAKVNTSLTPDFSSDTNVYVAFDLTNVRALQEDEDRKYARLNIGVQGQKPWITVNEARTDVGLPPVEGGDELVQPMPPQLRDFREEDEESGEEDELRRNGNKGGANGHRYPFRGWQGYP